MNLKGEPNCWLSFFTVMKVLFIHAHFDDYEFCTAGTFEVWRRNLNNDFHAKVIVCTDGKAGHHQLSRDETGRIRLEEQLKSSSIGEYDFEQLKLPNGEAPREACLQVDVPLLASLWKTIRDFEPDYLFCPPLPNDPLAGIHVDHVAVAEAIRRVAYMINVPHAFTPEYPSQDSHPKQCKVPVILNAYDGYMFGENAFDLVIDVSEAFDLVAEISWCHQSQVTEWLPWVGRHDIEVPKSIEEWKSTLKRRYSKRNAELGLENLPMAEFFTVTAWGEIPTLEQLKSDFPKLITPAEIEIQLAEKLTRWQI